MKKRTGKGGLAGKRQAKDLSPRRTRNVKGGELQSSIEKKNRDTVNSIIQKMA